MVFKRLLIVIATLAVANSAKIRSQQSKFQAKIPDIWDDETKESTRNGNIQKRSYSPWARTQMVQVPSYQTISHYKPPVYQLGRPYYIPVYGAPGRIPIYFPPQPFLINPSVPVKKPYMGPAYLPPYPETTTMGGVIKDRFNGDVDYDEDEGPIWGADAVPTTRRPQNAVSESLVPTRAPKVSTTRTTSFPPLLHEINQKPSTGGTNHLSAMDQDDSQESNRLGDNESPMFIQEIPLAPQAQNTRRTTTFRPEPSAPPSGPSTCVWAIVSCCSAASRDAPESCFEQRGCSGPFWGASPCEGDFARAAIESAINYYNTDG